MKTNWDLKNKTAFITGGTKGIGKATVIEFLELGAQVLFTARNEHDVKTLVQDLKANYQHVYGFAADVVEKEDIFKIKRWISENWGKLDVLVNNAGSNLRKATADYSTEEYYKILDINLTSVFNISRALFDLLKNANQSSIINVASVAGTLDVQTGSPYGISKAGLLQFTRNLAVEWAEHRIRVNSVSPWFTETPLTSGLLENETKIRKIIERTPLRRIAQPAEMANGIAFLAMDASSYITGQNLIIDGGMTANAL